MFLPFLFFHSLGKSEQGTAEFNLKQCQDQLRKLYLGPQIKVQLTPWLDEGAREMDAIFVNLEMEKDEDPPPQIKQKDLKRNEDLVTLQTDTGLRVNRILIQGDAGSGKSTLLNNIAYKWAKTLRGTDYLKSSDFPLSQFDLVFLISINEIEDEHKNDSLEEIIFDQILEEGSNVSQSGFKSYLKSNSERCLFLVDGIDEDSVGILNSTTSEMSKLIYYNKIYRNSCVIASTRPDTLKNTGRNKKLHVFTKVNLTGFLDENIEEYVKKHFAGNEVNYADLLKQLKKETAVWDLAGKPLLLMFFCVLWNDPDQAKRSLPNTRTKLYQETITSLWKRYHDKHDLSEEDEANEESQLLEIESFLENLGKIALEGLLDPKTCKENVLLKSSDIDKATLSLALRVGILSRKKITQKLGMISSVKFLHTSFQDYCSAIYLANLYHENNEKCKEYVNKMWKIIQNHECLCRTWVRRTSEAFAISEVFGFCDDCNPEITKLITHESLTAHNRQK